MPSCLHPTVKRARPLLGTLVSISVSGLPQPLALQAITDAFEAVSRVHHLMSVHDSTSELSRLNRTEPARNVPVSEDLRAVLEFALQLSALTDGAFDVTVGSDLMRWGLLPAGDTSLPQAATWRDVDLFCDGSVAFKRPLRLDFGGIAKGYAVDLATRLLRSRGASGIVNAGGDLRVFGDDQEQVLLRLDAGPVSHLEALPVIELEDGALASSSTSHAPGTHVYGRTRLPVEPGLFVAVAAPTCMQADALTKIALHRDYDFRPILRRFGATAYQYTAAEGWREAA